MYRWSRLYHIIGGRRLLTTNVSLIRNLAKFRESSRNLEVCFSRLSKLFPTFFVDDCFLVYDSSSDIGGTSLPRVIIFASPAGLAQLAASPHVYGDGTMKSIRLTEFSQLYLLCCEVGTVLYLRNRLWNNFLHKSFMPWDVELRKRVMWYDGRNVVTILVEQWYRSGLLHFYGKS